MRFNCAICKGLLDSTVGIVEGALEKRIQTGVDLQITFKKAVFEMVSCPLVSFMKEIAGSGPVSNVAVKNICQADCQLHSTENNF